MCRTHGYNGYFVGKNICLPRTRFPLSVTDGIRSPATGNFIRIHGSRRSALLFLLYTRPPIAETLRVRNLHGAIERSLASPCKPFLHLPAVFIWPIPVSARRKTFHDMSSLLPASALPHLAWRGKPNFTERMAETRRLERLSDQDFPRGARPSTWAWSLRAGCGEVASTRESQSQERYVGDLFLSPTMASGRVSSSG